MRERLALPIDWNDPPTKTVPPCGMIARTVLSAPGLHGVATTVVEVSLIAQALNSIGSTSTRFSKMLFSENRS